MGLTDSTGRLTVNAGVPLLLVQSYATYRAVQNHEHNWPKLVALATALLTLVATFAFEDETTNQDFALSKGELIGMGCAIANAAVAMTQSDDENRTWAYVSLGVGVLYAISSLGGKDIRG
jgi:hypothetical protein